MMVATAQQIALRQLQEIGDDARLIFVHPNYVQQHLLLHTCILNAAYVRFHGHALKISDLESQISDGLKQQLDPDMEHSDCLILDECDRADNQAFDQLVLGLLAQQKGRVILFSRRVPSVVMNHPQIRQVTRFVPSHEGLMLWDYAARNSGGGALLEVRAFGDGRVQLNGEPVDNWDGLLPRALFFYLVDRGMVTRNEIFETFWPNLTIREATNVFHVTKRKISEVLGMDLTMYWSGFYHISSHIQLSYDVAIFTQNIQDSAVMSLESSMELVKQSVDLYRGAFLTSIDMAWAIRRRADLNQMYSEALVSLARMNETLGKSHEALGQYLRAAVMNRQREDIVHHVMRLYRQRGMHDDALAAYQRLESELEKSLNLAPSKVLKDLAKEIERDRQSR